MSPSLSTEIDGVSVSTVKLTEVTLLSPFPNSSTALRCNTCSPWFNFSGGICQEFWVSILFHFVGSGWVSFPVVW